MRFRPRFKLSHIFIFVTIASACVFILKPEPRWWDLDPPRLTKYVKDRFECSRQVEVLRVSPDGNVSGVVDRSTILRLANSFELLSGTGMPAASCAEYFSITIVGENGQISFDVYDNLVMFGDGKWDTCAEIDVRFADILESTIVDSAQQSSQERKGE